MKLATRKAYPLKNSYEKQAWSQQQVVCGVDEVGRGCLAGPLVTAAVILHPNRKSPLVKDSKLLTKQELIKGFDWIIRNSWYAWGIISHTDIDTYNIYQANLMAMRRATLQLFTTCPYKPSTILVDAVPLSLQGSAHGEIPIIHHPKGELWSVSIAAASIIAKVKRDSLITKLDAFFPGYKLSYHKGYSTDIHCKAVRELGKSLIHRDTFLDKVLHYQENKDAGDQTSIC